MPPELSGWYVCRGESTQGPYPLAALRACVQRRTMPPDSLVSNNPTGPWLPLVDVLSTLPGSADGEQHWQTARPLAFERQADEPSRVQTPEGTSPRRHDGVTWLLGALALMIGAIATNYWLSRKPDQLAAVAGLRPEPAHVIEQAASADPAAPVRSSVLVLEGKLKLSSEELLAKCRNSLAMVRGRTGGGTGFLVRRGLLVTNEHVLSNQFLKDVRVEFWSDHLVRSETPRLVYESKDRDLALLAVEASFPPLPIAGDPAPEGATVYCIGNPSPDQRGQAVLINKLVTGTLRTAALVYGKEHYQIDAKILPGNSGGPVLLDTGEVIGVVDLRSVKEDGMAFCIPSWVLTEKILPQATRGTKGIAQAESRHRARVLLHRFDNLNRSYAQSMYLYSQGRYSVDALSRDLATAVKGAQLDEVEPELTTAEHDAILPETTRQNLSAYWDNYVAMYREIHGSRVDPSRLAYMARTLGARHQQIRNNLASVLESD
jgi:S1-C subfamily serine protease